MGYYWKWCEGEDTAIDLMQKVANDYSTPARCESYMHLQNITAKRIYLADRNGQYHEMWFLYYYAPNKGTIIDINEKYKNDCEDFRSGRLDYVSRKHR